MTTRKPHTHLWIAPAASDGANPMRETSLFRCSCGERRQLSNHLPDDSKRFGTSRPVPVPPEELAKLRAGQRQRDREEQRIAPAHGGVQR